MNTTKRRTTWKRKMLNALFSALLICLMIAPPSYGDAKPLTQSPIPDINDFTFVVVGDPQFYPEDPDSWRDDYMQRPVQEINRLGIDTSITWPASTSCSGNAVALPIAVLIAGDMTNTATDDDLKDFRKLYEPVQDYSDYYKVDGNAYKINQYLSAYPGAGNHEYQYGGDRADKMRAYIEQRMKNSNVITNYDPYTKNYSWDIGYVHFIQLNTWAGQIRDGDPVENRLTGIEWLAKDLMTFVGDSNRPVVIIQHYSQRAATESDWTADNKQIFINILNRRSPYDNNGPDNAYNILAIFSGHHHHPNRTTLDHFVNILAGDAHTSTDPSDPCDNNMAFLVSRIQTKLNTTTSNYDVTFDVANYNVQELSVDSGFKTAAGIPYSSTSSFSPVTMASNASYPYTLWQSLDGNLTSSPAPISYNGGTYIFAKGANNNLNLCQLVGGDHKWPSIDIQNSKLMRSKPAPIKLNTSDLYVFSLGKDSNIIYKSYYDNQWQNWQYAITSNNPQFNSAPAVVDIGGNSIMVFASDKNDYLYHATFLSNGTATLLPVIAWQKISITVPNIPEFQITGDPSALISGNKLYVIVQNYSSSQYNNKDKRLVILNKNLRTSSSRWHHKWFSSTKLYSSPGACLRGDKIFIYYRGNENELKYNIYNIADNTISYPLTMGHTIKDTPGLLPDKIFTWGEDDDHDHENTLFMRELN